MGKIKEIDNKFMRDARQRGVIDSREISAMADITCSNGNGGRAWILLNGKDLFICENIFPVGLGETLEVIHLEEAEMIKSSSFVLHSYMKLKYQGNTYLFKGFAQAKRVIAAITEACGGAST